MYDAKVKFPVAFQCYKPNTEKVYGTVCMSPQNRILLVRGRRSMKWSFPKGHKEPGESYLSCAVRETYEEAGLDLCMYSPVSHQRLSVGEYYFFEVEEVCPTVGDHREIAEAKWMSLSEIREAPCNVDVNYFLLRMKRGRVGKQPR